ncbi:MAG: nucleoside monophosphate kinase [Verrucomicrobia bacterium]|nr:nucleoside monophosphate kinase [Verrucomicrobiota bacterium]MCF7707835.1 nucleoside monophosphate kinase [Verrucomicrobiota bacterium]
MKRRLVLFGPPGSGKGTIAGHLEDEFGITHVSSGHLLRYEVESGSRIGKLAETFLERGKMVEDEIILEMMREWFEKECRKDGFVLDGFPRNIMQAEKLDEWLDAMGMPIELALYVVAEEKLVLERVSERRVCLNCGNIYNLVIKPPKNDCECDDCGLELVQREDDTEEVMKYRFALFHEETEPLVSFYENENKLVRIQAAQPLDSRLASVDEAIR